MPCAAGRSALVEEAPPVVPPGRDVEVLGYGRGHPPPSSPGAPGSQPPRGCAPPAIASEPIRYHHSAPLDALWKSDTSDLHRGGAHGPLRCCFSGSTCGRLSGWCSRPLCCDGRLADARGMHKGSVKELRSIADACCHRYRDRWNGPAGGQEGWGGGGGGPPQQPPPGQGAGTYAQREDHSRPAGR